LQLLIDDLEDAGDGALHLAFERLKRKLADEGLFATETKLPIPTSPRRIGILTSPVGAAIHDVLTTLRRRDPLLEVILYPVTVQGDAAAAQINAMLNKALLRQECDVLLLTRGGGSLEDLQAFNDERLARTIASAAIPIVSAIGHEVDFSICDFVADARAATPTAAAELLSPDRAQQTRHIKELRMRLVQELTRYGNRRRQQLHLLQMRLRNVSPQRRLLDRAQQLDDLQRRLILTIQQCLKRARQQLNHVTFEGRSSALAGQIREAQRLRDALHKRLLQLGQQKLNEKATRMVHLTERLQDLAPNRILARGYAIPWQGDTVLRDPTVPPGSKLRVQLAAGNIWTTVGEKS
jgi:exodeoxyribonuclease VII large subunit